MTARAIAEIERLRRRATTDENNTPSTEEAAA